MAERASQAGGSEGLAAFAARLGLACREAVRGLGRVVALGLGALIAAIPSQASVPPPLMFERVGDVEQLVAALAAVCRGESVIDPQVVDELMRHQARSATSPIARLTSREREVLALVATGAANAAVAQHLVITQRAVEKHINAIFAKLELPIGVARDRRVSAVLLYLADSGARTLADPGRR